MRPRVTREAASSSNRPAHAPALVVARASGSAVSAHAGPNPRTWERHHDSTHWNQCKVKQVQLEGLISAWLDGSRARGEPPHDESDVDVMQVTASDRDDADLVYELLWDAAKLEGREPLLASPLPLFECRHEGRDLGQVLGAACSLLHADDVAE